MPIGSFIHPLFGMVTFETSQDTWVRGDTIKFLTGFDPMDVTAVQIPQLVGIPTDRFGHAPSTGRVLFHERAHAQLLAVFADLELLGLMKFVNSFAGSFNMRLRKPTSGVLSRVPSNHSFGIAVDLNSDDGSNGNSVAPVAPVFEHHGFKWGKAFADPMHFEVETFIDHPRPMAQKVKVIEKGVELKLVAFNLQGHVFVNLEQAMVEFELARLPSPKGEALLKNGKTRKTLIPTLIGIQEFAKLTEVAGIAGLSVKWDNSTKVANVQ